MNGNRPTLRQNVYVNIDNSFRQRVSNIDELGDLEIGEKTKNIKRFWRVCVAEFCDKLYRMLQIIQMH